MTVPVKSSPPNRLKRRDLIFTASAISHRISLTNVIRLSLG